MTEDGEGARSTKLMKGCRVQFYNFRPFSILMHSMCIKNIIVEKLKHGKNLLHNVRLNCENFHL